MSIGEIRENDIGTALRGTIKNQDDAVVDISTATVRYIILHTPNGDKLTKTAALVTDGTDGKLQYITTSGVLTPIGWWKLQGYVKIGTSEYYSDIHRFQVHGNL